MGDLQYHHASGIISGYSNVSIFAGTGYKSGIEMAQTRRISRREEDWERDRTSNLEETMADNGYSRHCWIGRATQGVL